jgi:hypothetical protein
MIVAGVAVRRVVAAVPVMGLRGGVCMVVVIMRIHQKEIF